MNEEEIYDLLYDCEDEREMIQKQFPTAKIEDASDEIHQGRISITVKLARKDYYKGIMVMAMGLHECSLMMQMAPYEPDHIALVKEAVTELRVEHPEIFK